MSAITYVENEVDAETAESTPETRLATQPRRSHSDVDSRGLAAALSKAVIGEVRFDDGSRALYSTDGSNYRQVPIGVVIPKSKEDIVATVRTCREFGAPVLSRGGGTSLAGQCCNVAVVMDMSKYLHHVIEVDPVHKTARVEPGCVLDYLRNEAEKYHLTFGPDPATHNHNTLGGMIGNDSCGSHSVMCGPKHARTADNVHELEILTYDGLRMRVGATSEEELARIIAEGGRRAEIYRRLKALRDKYADQIRARFPDIPRRVSGYNLPDLLPENGFHVARALVGTEGTCVTVLEATLRLIDSPPVRSLLVLGYPDGYSAGDHVPEVMVHNPTACEGIDDKLIGYMKEKGMHPQDISILPEGGGWLLVEFGGQTKEEADSKARGLMDELGRKGDAPPMKLFGNKEEEERVWAVRESGLGATARIPNQPDYWPGWEDSAVSPEKVGHYLRDLRKLLDEFGYDCALYGHFGQGCVHCRINFDLYTHDGVQHWRQFLDRAADLVVSYGGSISGEHGDGQARAELLPKMFGDELIQAFREFKSIWDPEGKMNPGKIVDPYGITENLRLGENYEPWNPKTHFQFPGDDRGSFARATLRCVGVGNCRRVDAGTMCPSYMVTREEKDSTRGRSRLLFEMLQGEVISGWKSEAVRDALDLCLACKGCKGECPINVDMATYKAEFLSHYYEGRLRPVHAYSVGLIHRWAGIASRIPALANFVTHAPGLRNIAKELGGISRHRTIPEFAPYTFRQAFKRRQKGRRRESVNGHEEPVILWADTFNNYFHPATAEAALEVLEPLGFSVQVPSQALCCGRPLYDYGMLDSAKRLLTRTLDALRPQIRDGVPVVVLEPSCAAVFRDELVNLMPNDQDAQRLARQTFLLSEFLEKRVDHYQPPQLHRRAIVHGHCHHKAIMKMTDEESVLNKMGLDYNLLDSGCCGMAGGFGFEKEHYKVSMAVGERVLLPAVRNAEKSTILVADGFSCREQVSQTTGRRALHLAEVIHMAMQEGPDGPPKTAPPEKSYPNARNRPVSKLKIGLGLAAGALTAGLAMWALNGTRSRRR
jgi:FAD/FMN-containing dehydrogenase/Fe-S oxidoreductase